MDDKWKTPEGEAHRQQILHSYSLGHDGLQAQLDRLAGLAAQLCGTSIGIVSIVDAEQQLFIGKSGIAGEGSRREISFCAHAMHEGGCMVVPNALEDPRFAENPFVTDGIGIRFYAGQPLVSPEGAPLGSFCVIDDEPRETLTAEQFSALETLSFAAMDSLERWRVQAVSEKSAARSKTKFAELEQRFKVLADVMPQLVWSTLHDGSVDYLNSQWFTFTGMTEEECYGTGWLNGVHPDDREGADRAWSAAVAERVTYETEYRLRRADGTFRWVLARGLPIMDADGAVSRWIGTCTDIHDQTEAAEQKEVLSQELSHRIKNIFAVIGGLISISTRNKPELEPVAGDLHNRILALGRAHDFVRPHSDAPRLLSGNSDLKGLILQLLAPYQSADRERISLHADDDQRVDDRSATPLALFFHELATNSAKYGALSIADGRVEIRVLAGSECTIEWTECDGPPVTQPEKSGFGSQLLEMSIARQLGGTLDHHWLPEGLRIVARIPRNSLVRQSGAGSP